MLQKTQYRRTTSQTDRSWVLQCKSSHFSALANSNGTHVAFLATQGDRLACNQGMVWLNSSPYVYRIFLLSLLVFLLSELERDVAALRCLLVLNTEPEHKLTVTDLYALRTTYKRYRCDVPNTPQASWAFSCSYPWMPFAKQQTTTTTTTPSASASVQELGEEWGQARWLGKQVNLNMTQKHHVIRNRGHLANRWQCL